MIYIFSKDNYETNRIIDELSILTSEFIRIDNEINKIRFKSFTYDNENFYLNVYINESEKLITKYDVLYFSVGSFDLFEEYSIDVGPNNSLTENTYSQLSSIKNAIETILIKNENSINFLGFSGEVNKLKIIYDCIDLKITVPKTFITSVYTDLEEVMKKYNVITKSSSSNLIYKEGNSLLTAYVESLDDNKLRNLPDKFIPSLIQEKVNSTIEIRSLYIDGDFYHFVVYIKKTKNIDIRKDLIKGNFILLQTKIPKELEIKLRKLYRKNKFTIVSSDILYCAEKKEYYFLEANPNGRFLWITDRCNIFFETKIAKILFNKTMREYEKH